MQGFWMKRSALLFFAMTFASMAEQIDSIRFEGLQHLSPTLAKEIVGLQEGEELDLQKIDRAIKRFYSQGYFQDIWVEERNGELIFHFVEKPLIAQIEVVGYLQDKKEELPQILGIKKGDIYDERAIREAIERIKEYARAKGYFDTVVEVQTEPVGKNAVKVVFVVNKGEKVYIDRLTLCGAKRFDKDEIEDVVANRERHPYFGWMIGVDGGELRLDQLPYDKERIKNKYLTHGYLDVEVSDPFLRVNFDNYRAKLRYHIKEGKQYVVKEVRIEQLKPALTQEEIEELMEELRLRPGKIFNVEKLRRDLEKIRIRVADKGYAYARVVPDFRKEGDGVVIRYLIDPGEKVYIRDVIIAGNQRTLDRVIRREVYLAPGDLFSYTDYKDSLNALRRTGFFEEVQIEQRRVSQNEMDLVVKVKERPTGNIMIGGGYSSYEGFIFNAGINDRNIFGSGINGSLSVDLSSKSMRFNLGIFNPRLFDSEYSLGINAYNTEFESYDYTQKRRGASVTIGRKLTRHLSAALSYAYESNELSDVEYDDLYFQEGKYTKSALTPVVTFDNTDDYYLPRSGVAASASVEYAGLGGDEKFTKAYLKSAYYLGLEEYIDYDLILRFKAKGGYIKDNGYLPVFEKFFLGGIRTVRGYQIASISPTDDQGRLIGGKRMFATSFEASVPIMDKKNMRFTLFVDYGGIGENSYTEITRAGGGVALEWISPMGPLQLIFAKPINEKPEDRTSTFEFTIGQRF